MGEWILGLVALVFCFHNIFAEMVLTQSPSVSTTAGQTVKITCTMSGDSIGNYYVSWYWQKPASAPVYVWHGSYGIGPGIPNRFLGSVDSSSNRLLLTITNVQLEDAADYYCAVDKNYIFTFGKGTKLNLSSRRAPVVSVLQPPTEEIRRKGTATLVCLVSGFNPGAVNIEWTVDGSTRKNGVVTSRVHQETDNTFSASSYLTLPVSVWKSHERYSCVVEHETQATPFKANIARSSCM
ncbi:immunoglobulin lambda-1 light chain-like [Pristis pectinata]|uniref:immunoglobulin lambda-1 light chain-like n=1 Tax=Pristis pectinata TaxID=685728 RepID=UPI00223D10A1|nr:immunoglobulin lambda-1 light chain-like [Pristis pectinata]